ncbi:MAG: 16S rRNA (uracil(1498)-N(3))-methyltransferase [Armatimonadetes bacterium]|nr:16S rRNA (uracil(1498)-N(3))-methyltransferase [Armatimonadota bacterium]MDW8154801.1 RsmE family RNA methyltransferase [Armatimonadota bacterium]
MRRLFVRPDPRDPQLLHLDAREARHALRVLRLRVGDVFLAFDGRGGEWEAELLRTAPGVVARVLRPREGLTLPYRLTLYQGMPKGDRMDTVVRMGTELGIARFVPVVMERSVRVSGRVERWRRIAAEASKQCRRAQIPEVVDPLPFAQAVEGFARYPLRVFLWEGGGSPLLWVLEGAPEPTDLAVFVGPEGGFAEEEVRRLRGCAEAASLGPLVLRTETAGIAAAAVILSWFCATGRSRQTEGA